jgi:hypothetical protein
MASTARLCSYYARMARLARTLRSRTSICGVSPVRSRASRPPRNLDSPMAYLGKAAYKCESAYGSGIPCLKPNSAAHKSYAPTSTSYAQPTGYSTPQTMAGDLTAGFAKTAYVPVAASTDACAEHASKQRDSSTDHPDRVLPRPAANHATGEASLESWLTALQRITPYLQPYFPVYSRCCTHCCLDLNLLYRPS